MAEIRWYTWLGIGLFVLLASIFVGTQLRIFVWVGLIFIIVGIVKLVIFFVFKKKETKAEKKHAQVPQMHAQRGVYCPRCRITIQPTDNFCKYCGTRLR